LRLRIFAYGRDDLLLAYLFGRFVGFHHVGFIVALRIFVAQILAGIKFLVSGLFGYEIGKLGFRNILES
tara:strand:+ start:378 stop:584 length:207 start_codon:yes stop_codon:yes gene_type:complete